MRSSRAVVERAARAACGALALLTLLGCSEIAGPRGERTGDVPARGGTLRTALRNGLRTLDPAVAFDTSALVMELLLFDRLMGYDARGQLVPELAESVRLSSDGRSVAVRLRRRVLFHDGGTLTAHDVKRSLERALHPKTPCPVPTYFDRLVGFEAFRSGSAPALAGIVVEGELDLRFELREPDATFAYALALPTASIVCRSAGDRYDPSFSQRACGTGPFRLSALAQDRRADLTRFDGHWSAPRPYVERIEIELGMAPLAQRFRFELGELDLLFDLTEADAAVIARRADYAPYRAFQQLPATMGMFLNTEARRLKDVRVRRALALAVDRDELLLLKPQALTATRRLIPPALLAGPDIAPKHDAAAALALLTEAGFFANGEPAPLRYATVNDGPAAAVAEVVAMQLARVGVKVRIEPMSWPTYLASVSRRHSAELGYFGWMADYPEPSTFLEPILTTAAIQEEESMNTSFFSDRVLDDRVARARRTVDAGERSRLYREAEARVGALVPLIPLHGRRQLSVWQPRLRGYEPHPVLPPVLRDVWLTSAERTARVGRTRSVVRALPWVVAGGR